MSEPGKTAGVASFLRNLPGLLALAALSTAACKHRSMTVTWARTFGGHGADYGYSVQQTSDGGYIVAGTQQDTSSGSAKVCLVRTDQEGHTLWAHPFPGGLYSDVGYSVRQTSDGGFIVAGAMIPDETSYVDFFLAKTDSQGSELWSKNFGTRNFDQGRSVLETPDGGFVVVGVGPYPTGGGPDRVWFVKTDASGNRLWGKTFGGPWDNAGYSVSPSDDGGFIIAGYTESVGVGTDVYLIRTNANGDTLWTRAFGGAELDFGYSVQQTTDGGFIVAGSTSSFGAGNEDVYLVKTSAAGDSAWTRTFGGPDIDQGYSVQQTADGGFIIAGCTRSFGAGWDDAWLIKTDGNGDTLWTKTFGGPHGDYGYSVQETSDHGFIIAGTSSSFGAGGSDIYLIKADSLGGVEP